MRLTTEKEEQQWIEFKNHLEWAKLFSLIILFVDDDFLVDVFRTRLYHQQKGYVSTLKILKPENKETLTRDFFAELETEVIPDVKVPLWLEIYYPGNDWDKARDLLFSRLNEYRDKLRNNFHYPVIILVPLSYKRRLRDIAPDLWSVRNFTDELLAGDFPTRTESPRQNEHHLQQQYDFQTKAQKAPEVIEWQRVRKQTISNFELLQVGWRALNIAMQLGAWQLAEEVVNVCLPLAQEQVHKTDKSPQYLRFQAIFLSKKGDLEHALGRREAAYELYQESLKIRRRLRETLGETPETLRDLSVSLNNVGQQENILGKTQVAEKHFRECLCLLQRLHATQPDNQEYLTMISYIEDKL